MEVTVESTLGEPCLKGARLSFRRKGIIHRRFTRLHEQKKQRVKMSRRKAAADEENDRVDSDAQETTALTNKKVVKRHLSGIKGRDCSSPFSPRVPDTNDESWEKK